MKFSKKVSAILQSACGNKFEVVFDTDDYRSLKELLEFNGFADCKIIDWKLKQIIFIK